MSDINSIRFGSSVTKETRYWKNIRYFIFQSERMRECIEKLAGKKISVNIGLFDLLFEPKIQERRNSAEVVFAGNTAKCPFVNDLYKVEEITWNIYSGNYVKSHRNVHHIQLEDEINNRPVLEGSYGLIWEGSSIDNISNPAGKYLELVSPLKLSNYLLNGLPVITHHDAALAKFVVENKIGFCVSSLNEIKEKINSITEDEYRDMLTEAKYFSERIASGYYMQSAVSRILEKMEKKN